MRTERVDNFGIVNISVDGDTRRPEGDMPAVRDEHRHHPTTRKGGKQD